jgi:hypothetical protein
MQENVSTKIMGDGTMYYSKLAENKKRILLLALMFMA